MDHKELKKLASKNEQVTLTTSQAKGLVSEYRQYSNTVINLGNEVALLANDILSIGYRGKMTMVLYQKALRLHQLFKPVGMSEEDNRIPKASMVEQPIKWLEFLGIAFKHNAEKINSIRNHIKDGLFVLFLGYDFSIGTVLKFGIIYGSEEGIQLYEDNSKGFAREQSITVWFDTRLTSIQIKKLIPELKTELPLIKEWVNNA